MRIENVLENKQKIIKRIVKVIKIIVISTIITYFFVMYNNMNSFENNIAIKRVEIKNEIQRELEMLAEIENITKDVVLDNEIVREEFIQARFNVNETIKGSDLYDLNLAYNEMFIAFKNYDKIMRKNFKMFNKDEYIEKANMLISIRQNVVDARKEYYSSVVDYNSYIKIFPNKIVAYLLGFEEMKV